MDYDLLVIGAGTAGSFAARRGIALKARTAIVEQLYVRHKARFLRDNNPDTYSPPAWWLRANYTVPHRRAERRELHRRELLLRRDQGDRTSHHAALDRSRGSRHHADDRHGRTSVRPTISSNLYLSLAK